MRRPVPAVCSLLLLVFVASTAAQAQMKIGFHYKVKENYSSGGPANIYYKNGSRTLTKHIPTLSKWKKIFCNHLKAWCTADSAGKVTIEFWRIPYNTYAGSDHYVNRHDSVDNFYFQVTTRETLDDPTYFISVPYVVTEVGVMTIPFKYWNGRGNVPNHAETDFNAGAYVARKWGRQRFYPDKDKNHESATFAGAVFFGPSKVEIDEDHVKDTLMFTKESAELALSLGGGILYTYRKFNMGLFGGWDFPLSTAGRNWLYSRKFWIGFGIGYSLDIFSHDEK